MPANDQYVVELVVNVQQDKAIQALMNDMRKMAKATSPSGAVSKGMKNTSSQFKNMGYQVQNASYQLTDFIVMVQGGINPMRAFSQQAPQLLAGFGAMGAAVGVVSALLPSMLLAMGKGADIMKTLTDETEEATEAWQAYREQMDLFVASGERVDKVLADLLEQKAFQEQSEQFAKLNAEAEKVVGSSFWSDAASTISGFWDAITDRSNENPSGDATMQRILDQQAAVKKGSEELRNSAPFGSLEYYHEYQRITESITPDNLRDTIVQLNNLADLMRTTADPALVKRIEDLALAMGDLIPDQRADALKSLEALLDTTSKFDKQRNEFKEYFDEGLISALQFEQALNRISNLEIAANFEKNIQKSSGSLNKLIREMDSYLEQQQRVGDQLRAAADPMFVYQQELDKLYVLLQQGVINWDTYAHHVEAAEKTLQTAMGKGSFGVAAVEAFDRSFQSFINGVAAGTADVKDLFKNMVSSMMAELARLAAYKTIMSLFGGTEFGANFGAQTGATAWAKGGAFVGGAPVQAFAAGGVVSGPTVFPMAKGMGLMGEAGPEAIMPLTRMGNGNLGVEAAGFNVTVNQMAPGVQVETSRDENGLTIDVVMDQVAAAIHSGGNPIAQSLEQTYTLGRGRGVY